MMELGKALKKAMIDNSIEGAKQLSEDSGMTYGKVTRLLRDDKTSRLIDAESLADFLGLKIKVEVK